MGRACVPLGECAGQGCVRQVQVDLDAGVPEHQPAHRCCRAGEGPTGNQTDDKGYTPLILATYNDNFEVAQLLLKHGANTEVKDHSGRTALMGASFKGNEREVKLLLDNGANASAVDSKGMTSMT